MRGFPATPGASWCGTKGWDKLAQRGVVQPCIAVLQVVGLASIALLHSPDAPHPGAPRLA